MTANKQLKFKCCYDVHLEKSVWIEQEAWGRLDRGGSVAKSLQPWFMLKQVKIIFRELNFSSMIKLIIQPIAS